MEISKSRRSMDVRHHRSYVLSYWIPLSTSHRGIEMITTSLHPCALSPVVKDRSITAPIHRASRPEARTGSEAVAERLPRPAQITFDFAGDSRITAETEAHRIRDRRPPRSALALHRSERPGHRRVRHEGHCYEFRSAGYNLQLVLILDKRTLCARVAWFGHRARSEEVTPGSVPRPARRCCCS